MPSHVESLGAKYLRALEERRVLLGRSIHGRPERPDQHRALRPFHRYADSELGHDISIYCPDARTSKLPLACGLDTLP